MRFKKLERAAEPLAGSYGNVKATVKLTVTAMLASFA
jgi:hypothetical protein